MVHFVLKFQKRVILIHFHGASFLLFSLPFQLLLLSGALQCFPDQTEALLGGDATGEWLRKGAGTSTVVVEG